MPTSRMLGPREAATVTATCPRCSKTFGAKQTKGGFWYIATFCTRGCSRRATAARKPILPQVCPQCRREFTRAPSAPDRVYCDTRCGGEARRGDGFIRKRNGYPVFWTGKAEVLVHRIVMEHKLGRPLRDTETVHHINGDRMDWRDENLELWDHAQPHGQRVSDKIAWCVEYLNLHGYTVTAP